MPEWIQKYTESFIQTDKLQQIVDSFMGDYDKQKEEVRILLLFLQHRLPISSPCDVNLFLFVTGSREAEEGG